MKKQGLIFLIITLLIISCNIINKKNKQKKYFEFNKAKTEIKIPIYKNIGKTLKYSKIDYKKNGYRGGFQKIKKNSSDIVITYSLILNQLDFINIINGNVLAQISLPKTQRQLTRFYYINNDSIILQYMPNKSFLHDSTLMLINNKGKIINIYSLKNSGVFCSENPEMYNNDNSVYLRQNIYQDFTYKNGKIFLNFERKGSLGDPANSDIPFAGYINMKENKFYSINIEYPDIIYDGKHMFNYPEQRFFTLFAHDGDLLYAFKHTPTILKYNIETKKTKEIRLKSTVFDTIYSFQSKKDFPRGLDYDMPYPKYYNLQYDSINKLYYRYILLPSQYGGKFNFSVIIADTSFNYIAEGLMPHARKMKFSITNNGCYRDNDSLYRITYKKGLNKELILKIKSMNQRKIINKPLTNYVKNFGNINDEDYTAIFFWIEASCNSTQDGVLGFYKKFADSFIKNNTHLYVISLDKEHAMENIKRNNLIPYTKDIIIDTIYRFAEYTNYKVLNMPRVIKVRKNKIITDTIFEASPEGSEAFQEFVMSSTKEQESLKNK